MDIREILDTLPHRPPMLLVDRILEAEFPKRIKGLKNVTMNEPFFQGHYPGNPIMPGVLILESMAQASCVLLLKSEEHRGKTPIIGAIDDVRFRRPVVPGDTLIHDVELLWFKRGIGKIKGTSSVDGEIAAEMTLTFSLQANEPE